MDRAPQFGHRGLPEAPGHSPALDTLAEVVPLRYGQPLDAALGADDRDAIVCPTPRCHATVETLTRTPLVVTELVLDLPTPRAGDYGSMECPIKQIEQR